MTHMVIFIGDRVLNLTGETFTSVIHGTDAIARWGGEACCVLTYGMTPTHPLELAKRIRQEFKHRCTQQTELNNETVTLNSGIAANAHHKEIFKAVQNIAVLKPSKQVVIRYSSIKRTFPLP